MKFDKSFRITHIFSTTTANTILFILVLITLFLVPLLPAFVHQPYYAVLFTAILIMGTQLISRNRRLMLVMVVFTIAMIWLADVVDMPVIKGISKSFNAIFFIFMVYDLVRQVGMARNVTRKVILESINGYLMIGLVFSVIVAFMMGVNEGSFSFHNLTVASGHNEYPYHMYIYYAFITMTTTGYGDIVPLTPVARSLAVFISVTGQLYVAVVIALLVGKYITQQVNSNRE